MAATASRARIGLGIKVIWTQSGLEGEICQPITGFGAERASIDVTHMGSPHLEGAVNTNGEMMPAGIARLRAVTIVMHFDASRGLPKFDEPETIELVMRRRKTEATPAKLRATGFLSSFDLTIPMDDKMTWTSSWHFTGDYTYIKPTLL